MNKQHRFLLVLVMAIACWSLGLRPSRADATDFQLRVRGCGKLAIRSVEEQGRVVYLRHGKMNFIFSVRLTLMQADQDPVGTPVTSPVITPNHALRIETRPDGTVRWISQTSGVERLALCMNSAGSEWIALTRSGYYVASEHGGQLAGFEVAGPTAQPDFFPLELLRTTFHHAEVVSRVLASNDDDKKIAATLFGAERLPPTDIRLALPPILQVLWPPIEYPTNSTKLHVKLRVRSPGGLPIDVLASSASGAPQLLHIERNAASAAEEKSEVFDVDIPHANSTVEIRAQSMGKDNRPVATTPPVSIRITWTGDKRVEAMPDVYLLAIGVGKYRDANLTLDYPSKDARDFQNAFLAQRGKNYREVISTVLEDENATRANILSELNKLGKLDLRENDLAIVFLAGHGDGSENTDVYRFLPYDAVRAAPEKTMIDAALLQDVLRKRKGGRMLFFIDSCHSGNAIGGGSYLKELAGEIAREGNVVVLTSSTSGQVSREWRKWENGAFTKAVVEGLEGKADYKDTGQVTITMLESYVDQRVRELTGDAQTPTSIKPGPVANFSIAKVSVPFWRRSWVRGTLASAVVGSLVAGSIAFGILYHPEYQRGNTGWLVQF